MARDEALDQRSRDFTRDRITSPTKSWEDMADFAAQEVAAERARLASAYAPSWFSAYENEVVARENAEARAALAVADATKAYSRGRADALFDEAIRVGSGLTTRYAAWLKWQAWREAPPPAPALLAEDVAFVRALEALWNKEGLSVWDSPERKVALNAARAARKAAGL